MFISISGIINTTTDFLCTVLPASIVLKLKMPLRKRLIAASLFLVGIFVNVASALRIYYTYYEYESGDTWNLLPSSVCSNLELGLGLVSSPPPLGSIHQTTTDNPSCVSTCQSSDLLSLITPIATLATCAHAMKTPNTATMPMHIHSPRNSFSL